MEDLTRIRVDIADYIAVVTMDYPPVNAQDRQFHEEMTLAFDRFSEMRNVRVVILTGAGKVFSAGADLKSRATVAWAPGDDGEGVTDTEGAPPVFLHDNT